MRPAFVPFFCALFMFCLATISPAVPKAQAEAMPPLETLVGAINQGDIDKVRVLLAAGTALHLEDENGLSALDHALAYSPYWAAPELVHLLLQHGAQPGSGKDGQDLALARLIARRALPAELQSFLAAGFDADGRLANGFTPFLWAAACGVAPEYIDILVEHGAPLDQALPPNEQTGSQMGDNALLLAAHYNPQTAVLRALLRQGLDVNTRSNALGDSALMLSLCENPELETAQALLDAGADVQVSNGISYTAFLCAARREGASNILRFLVKRGADAADVADGGGTAMHEAAMRNPDTEVIQTLLDLGTPISGMSAENEAFLSTDSVFKLALDHNPNPAVIRILLEKGVDSSRRDDNGKFAWETLTPERKAWLAKNGLDTLLLKVAAAATTKDTQKAVGKSGKTGVAQLVSGRNTGEYEDFRNARLALRDVSKETDTADFPDIKGKLMQALRYQDKSGENLILLTRTEEAFRRVGEDRLLAATREIFAYRFLIQGSKAEQQWQVRDYVLDCPYEIEIEFISAGLQVTDLDADGLAELWLPYRLGCRAEQGPITMKIIMYEGGQKYALRGQTRAQNPSGEYDGGDSTMDSALRDAPQRFRDFAVELWQTHMQQ